MNLFWKKKNQEEEPIVRLAKLLLSEAVKSGASKIVFGSPPEDGFDRLPLLVKEGQRFYGRDGQEIKHIATENGQHVNHPEMLSLPCWFTVENAHREVDSLPAYLFFDLLEILKKWHDDRIMSQVAARQAQQETAQEQLWRAFQVPVFSVFSLKLEEGRVLLATLGIEPNGCFSVTINHNGHDWMKIEPACRYAIVKPMNSAS